MFATLLVALGDALAVDRYATTDLDRIEAAIMAAASLLAGLVGAPTTFPEPDPEPGVAPADEAATPTEGGDRT